MGLPTASQTGKLVITANGFARPGEHITLGPGSTINACPIPGPTGINTGVPSVWWCRLTAARESYREPRLRGGHDAELLQKSHAGATNGFLRRRDDLKSRRQDLP